MEINYIRTNELIELVTSNANRWIEARLRFGNFSATHYLFFNGSKLFDEGIDGEEREVTPFDFINHYQNCWWQVDNII